jgi:hypothetical protein
MYLRKVVFPVPALPVKKTEREVLLMNSPASVKTALELSRVINTLIC